MGLVVPSCPPLSPSVARSLPFPGCTALSTLCASLRSPALGESLTVVFGCWLTCIRSPITMPEVADTCSLASPASVCRTQHLYLRCSVDFDRRALTGTAALTVQSQEDNLRSLVRVACAAPLLRGRCPPAPRPCSPRALRSLPLPACPLLGLPYLFLSSHTHPFVSPTFTSALFHPSSTYDGLFPLPPLFLDTS